MSGGTSPPNGAVDRLRRSRSHPRLTQWDGLHLRILRRDLELTLGRFDAPLTALDIYCGTRPYEDLLPSGSQCTGLDINDDYGTADVVSDEFLPFEDASFDLVMCIEGFYYVEDPPAGVAEIRRVLRPGGTALITVPLVWEYDREILEHRYTGPQLALLFDGWDEVEVVENGGRAVSWAALTGRLLNLAEIAIPPWPRRILHPLFALLYAAINLVGGAVERVESGRQSSSSTLPMNLLLTARKPAAG